MESSGDCKPSGGRLLRLASTDNVAVAIVEFQAGETAWLDGAQVMLQDHICAGHKVAIAAIAPGQKVYKFGCPIGSATRPIRVGEHVHVHNLKSDYFPTFTARGLAHFQPDHTPGPTVGDI
jgi:altronate dehydratase small subunit